MGLLSKVKALGSLTRKKKYSKQELAFIEEARRALIDWGVACETAGPAEVEALYLLEPVSYTHLTLPTILLV